MRGLWKKDLALIGTNRSMLAAVVLVTVLMILAQNYQFVMFYAALMGGFQILGTITYDTANDGMQYLLTLPVTRSQYTAEKYLFGYGFGLYPQLSPEIRSIRPRWRLRSSVPCSSLDFCWQRFYRFSLNTEATTEE